MTREIGLKFPGDSFSQGFNERVEFDTEMGELAISQDFGLHCLYSEGLERFSVPPKFKHLLLLVWSSI